MQNTQSTRRGFTLIEMLIVVLIIAILAAVACGAYPDVQAAVGALVKPSGARTAPTEALTALYDERYGVFRSLYPALKAPFRAL